MPQRLSRRKIASYVANQLMDGASKRHLLSEVAAYLTETGRVREYRLIVRDIEDVLAERGVVVTEVTSAHPLSERTRRDIVKLIGATDVQLRETVDETILGGVRVDVPGSRFDGTIRRKINALKAKQI